MLWLIGRRSVTVHTSATCLLQLTDVNHSSHCLSGPQQIQQLVPCLKCRVLINISTVNYISIEDLGLGFKRLHRLGQPA